MRLQETSQSLEKEKEVSAARQSENAELQQRIVAMTTHQQNTEQQLHQSENSLKKLQASSILSLFSY